MHRPASSCALWRRDRAGYVLGRPAAALFLPAEGLGRRRTRRRTFRAGEGAPRAIGHLHERRQRAHGAAFDGLHRYDFDLKVHFMKMFSGINTKILIINLTQNFEVWRMGRFRRCGL